MANNPEDDGAFRRHLDASGSREVVFCHMCSRQWYSQEHGLTCPGCGGEITEIVSDEFDPRPTPPSPRIQRPPTPPGFTSLRNFNPWTGEGDSDPEEEDITQHVTHGPNSVIFTQTIHSPRRLGGRSRANPGIPASQGMAGEFQTMIGNILGPEFQTGVAGRSSGPGLFNPPQVNNSFQYTFTTHGTGPGTQNGPHPGGQPELDVAALLDGLFGQMNPNAARGGNPNTPGMPPGMPPAFHGFFAHLLNPANARSGDAVYTQEAFDAILTEMMNRQPASNAPGPATAESISSLPKKRLDEEMLGPEGKGECSVCMDDVVMDDEVVILPCSHWFHETCAGIWLQQHNTCPICRKGIGSETPPAQDNQSGVPRSQSQAARLNRNNRSRDLTPRVNNTASSAERREARLQSIRDLGQRSPNTENGPSPDDTGRRIRRRESMGPPSRSEPSSPRSTPRSRPDFFSPPFTPEHQRYVDTRSERPRDARRSSASIHQPVSGDQSNSSRRTSASNRQPVSGGGESSPPRRTSASNRQPGSGSGSGLSRRNSQASGASSTGAGSTAGAFSWIRDRLGGGGGGGGSSSRRNP